MPITEKNGKWYWGEKGPYNTKEAAQRVATAAYLSGYKKKTGVMPKKKPYRGKFIRDGKIIRKVENPTKKSKQWLIDTVEKSYPQITNLKIRGGSNPTITFDCHNLKWIVNLNAIQWSTPFGIYKVCVVNSNATSALYDHFLTRVDVIANQIFSVVPVLEFAWELYQLDLAYPKIKFYGEYYTPMQNTSSNEFWEIYSYLRDVSRVDLDDENSHRFNPSLWAYSKKNKEVYNETIEMAKQKIEFVRELYQQIFGGSLRP